MRFLFLGCSFFFSVAFFLFFLCAFVFFLRFLGYMAAASTAGGSWGGGGLCSSFSAAVEQGYALGPASSSFLGVWSVSFRQA